MEGIRSPGWKDRSKIYILIKKTFNKEKWNWTIGGKLIKATHLPKHERNSSYPKGKFLRFAVRSTNAHCNSKLVGRKSVWSGLLQLAHPLRHKLTYHLSTHRSIVALHQGSTTDCTRLERANFPSFPDKPTHPFTSLLSLLSPRRRPVSIVVSLTRRENKPVSLSNL